jgi:hypothetical protein
VQETSVYVAVRAVLIEPLAGNGRVSLTPILGLSGRVYRALLNNRLFQLVVPDTCINKPLPINGFSCHNMILTTKIDYFLKQH